LGREKVGGLEEGLLPSDSNSDSDSEVAGVWTGRGTGVGAGPDERDDCAGMNAKGGRGVVGGGSVFIRAARKFESSLDRLTFNSLEILVYTSRGFQKDGCTQVFKD
jgi:hypothetical protein